MNPDRQTYTPDKHPYTKYFYLLLIVSNNWQKLENLSLTNEPFK